MANGDHPTDSQGKRSSGGKKPGNGKTADALASHVTSAFGDLARVQEDFRTRLAALRERETELAEREAQAREREQLLASQEAKIAEIAVLEEQIAAKRNDLRAVEEQIAGERDALERQRNDVASQKALVERLHAEVAEREATIARREQAVEAFRRMLAQMSSALSETTPASVSAAIEAGTTVIQAQKADAAPGSEGDTVSLERNGEGWEARPVTAGDIAANVTDFTPEEFRKLCMLRQHCKASDAEIAAEIRAEREPTCDPSSKKKRKWF